MELAKELIEVALKNNEAKDNELKRMQEVLCEEQRRTAFWKKEAETLRQHIISRIWNEMMEENEVTAENVMIHDTGNGGTTTVVNWTDGDRTIAVRREKETPLSEKEIGILICLAKKAIGSNEEFHNEFLRMCEEAVVIPKKAKAKKQPKKSQNNEEKTKKSAKKTIDKYC